MPTLPMSCSGAERLRVLMNWSGQRGRKARMALQQVRQFFHVGLGAQDVVAGFRVAGLGQVGQGADADLLGQVVLGHAPGHLGFEPGVLVAHAVAGPLGLELGAHPRQHHRGLDGFGDVVEGPQLEPALLVAGIGQRGDEHHRDVAGDGVVSELCQHRIAVHAGHHHVEQDQVGPGLGQHGLQRVRARVGGAHLVGRAQQPAEHGEVHRLIVDDQDGGLEGGADGHGQWGARRRALRRGSVRGAARASCADRGRCVSRRAAARSSGRSGRCGRARTATGRRCACPPRGSWRWRA